jgi:hypothetical protein
VAREREQLPGLQGGELRHHRFQWERTEAPARRLLQQGTKPVQRVERAQVRGGCRDTGSLEGVWGEGAPSPPAHT